MDIITNYFKLNICVDLLENNNITIQDFLKDKTLRKQIISALLNENFTYKDYTILNIILIQNSFIVELEINQFNTSIIRFSSLKEALSFCLYIHKSKENNEKNNTKNINNLSLYLLNNFYYLIIENQNTYNIKYSDFEFMKYSPLIHSKILESGFKLSL